MIKLIAIVDEKFGVSRDGRIPWSFAEDLQFFKTKTMGQAVIMGAKTYASLPKGYLPGRINCVVSRHITQLDKGFLFRDIESAIAAYPDAWIIGGASIYNYVLKHGLVDYALLTMVLQDYKADKFINPEYLPNQYNCIFSNEHYEIRSFEFSRG